jgi:hypothetical protein
MQKFRIYYSLCVMRKAMFKAALECRGNAAKFP